MQSSTDNLVEELQALIKQAPQHYPVKPLIKFYPEEESFGLLFQIRTDSFSFSNERTDLHDSLSMLFAVFLRVTTGFSSALFDMENEFSGIEVELYARFLSIEQPQGPNFPLDEVGIDVARGAILALSLFPEWLSNHLQWIEGPAGSHPESSNWRQATNWAEQISRALKLPEDTEKSYMARINPTWMHFRCIHPRVSVLHVPGISQALHGAVSQGQLWDVVRAPNRLLFVSDKARNSIALRDLSLVRKILRACEPEHPAGELAIIPLDNYLVAIGGHHVVSIYRDCGRKRFEKDRDRVRQSFAETVSVLFPTPSFKWNDPINDDDFERLILTLLARDPQVSWVRKVGSTRDRDAGRDLLAEWTTLPLPGETLPEGAPPLSLRRVVVQCKAYSRPVDKSKVSDIRDVVEHHGATGYFLAVSSSLTSGLFDHLDRLRLGGKLWVDWWTRQEIEERLQAYPDIVSKFSDIVSAI